MQVHRDEGVANHIGPEPCAGIREDAAKRRQGIDRPAIEPRKRLIPGAHVVLKAEGDTVGRDIASARTPGVV